MTPQEKAKDLVNKFNYACYECDYVSQAIESALIAVDEIQEALQHNAWQNRDWIDYYNEVKAEIEKLNK